MSSPPFFLRDSRASETRARVKITPRKKRRHAAGRENSIIFLSPRRVSPLLAWGNFHARLRFARPTIPEEKWGTTCSLRKIILHSLSQVRETVYNSIEQIFIKQIVPKRLCIATTVYLSSQVREECVTC